MASDVPYSKGIRKDSSELSGYNPLSTINVGQQATDSQRMGEEIDQESQLTHLVALESNHTENDKDPKENEEEIHKIENNSENHIQKQDNNQSDNEDEYEVKIKKQKSQLQPMDDNNDPLLFNSSDGSGKDLDDCEIL